MNRRSLLKSATLVALGYPFRRLSAFEATPQFTADPFVAGVAWAIRRQEASYCGHGCCRTPTVNETGSMSRFRSSGKSLRRRHEPRRETRP